VLELAAPKIEAYNPDQEEESEWVGEQLGWFNMVLRYADCNDHLLLWFGLLGACTFGACLPGICLLFGNMIDGVGADAAAARGGAMGEGDFMEN